MGVARVSDIGDIPGNNFQIPKTTDVQVANDYLLASYEGVSYKCPLSAFSAMRKIDLKLIFNQVIFEDLGQHPKTAFMNFPAKGTGNNTTIAWNENNVFVANKLNGFWVRQWSDVIPPVYFYRKPNRWEADLGDGIKFRLSLTDTVTNNTTIDTSMDTLYNQRTKKCMSLYSGSKHLLLMNMNMNVNFWCNAINRYNFLTLVDGESEPESGYSKKLCTWDNDDNDDNVSAYTFFQTTKQAVVVPPSCKVIIRTGPDFNEQSGTRNANESASYGIPIPYKGVIRQMVPHRYNNNSDQLTYASGSTYQFGKYSWGLDQAGSSGRCFIGVFEIPGELFYVLNGAPFYFNRIQTT